MDSSSIVKSPSHIPASAFDFLMLIKQNNNREWFHAHKEEYDAQFLFIEHFAESLLAELNTHDLIETPSGKKSLQRIYRDTRFSKEKFLIKIIGLVGLSVQPNKEGEGITFIWNPVTLLLEVGFKRLIRKI